MGHAAECARVRDGGAAGGPSAGGGTTAQPSLSAGARTKGIDGGGATTVGLPAANSSCCLASCLKCRWRSGQGSMSASNRKRAAASRWSKRRPGSASHVVFRLVTSGEPRIRGVLTRHLCQIWPVTERPPGPSPHHEVECGLHRIAQTPFEPCRVATGSRRPALARSAPVGAGPLLGQGH